MIAYQRNSVSDKMLGAFWLGGLCSRDYGIILTEMPPEVFAERDVEKISVAGRSGDLVFDKGRYKNIEIPYKCAIIPNASETYRDCAIRAVQFLASTANYMRLENAHDPDHYRLARISNTITIENLVEQGGRFEIDFGCKPQRYLFSGLEPISFIDPAEMHNAYMTALPIIKVYGTGDGAISIGGTVVQIIGQTDPITMDCDTQNAYYETADGILENRNHQIYAPKFPQLLPGVNAIGWSGGVERLEITPRWWTL